MDIVERMEADGHPAVPLMLSAARESPYIKALIKGRKDRMLPSMDDWGTDKVVIGVRCSSSLLEHYSPSAAQVWLPTHMTEATKPFSEEMPHELLRTFRADPSSTYAAEWRDFVTIILAPGVAKLAAIMDAHQSVMELPPMEWCEANFPAFS